MPQFASESSGHLRRYTVPEGLNPAERFEHWRTWYGSAVETPMRLEKSAHASPVLFTPSAISLAGPGFSLIEIWNAPALGSWAPNPDTRDIRLAYFRKAPTLTVALNGEPEPVSPGSVRFVDTSVGGSFNAPEGFHAVQINIDRSSLDMSETALGSLIRLPDLAKHPIVGTFVVPALLSWKRPGIDREALGTADILRSVTATLVGSLLDVPVEDEAQKPALSRAVKKFLDASYANPDLDVAMVAERFNLSRRSLFYFFENEEFHLGERIRALRTRKALELLLQADTQGITYSEIAVACGFTNVQSMRRAVKEFTGMNVREIHRSETGVRVALQQLRESLMP
ncbi:helix-turn-helix domain-containing protein [Arthrobacter bambusae]|uniref:helix-turn-helix domain-containing protein n=1 Tax=Arthrobacter bambusae TaxID=1338426 RepID=UPI0027860187|nr:helix-turn-helix domain-containing protein [Arthrobacter bambusae]MDQ0028518.1 AraC-like DNA-binding protein [Arthrobacter bambusae]MDQ0096688.1 AraC-like DNA-binding protein [Arthrobacter bambusae]